MIFRSVTRQFEILFFLFRANKLSFPYKFHIFSEKALIHTIIIIHYSTDGRYFAGDHNAWADLVVCSSLKNLLEL